MLWIFLCLAAACLFFPELVLLLLGGVAAVGFVASLAVLVVLMPVPMIIAFLLFGAWARYGSCFK